MKNEELHQLIKAVPKDVELDYDGKFTARIYTDNHIFECDYFTYKDWFGNQSIELSSGSLFDYDEGKEITLTDLQSKMICGLFRPLLLEACKEGVFT